MSSPKQNADFWLSSGHHLLDHDAAGRLVVTDEFLKVYLARPEVVPPADACIIERAVYQRLTRAPRTPVDTAEIAAMADRDARENWQYFINFRDVLLAEPTLEAAYLRLVRTPKVTTPLLFLNQLVQVIARNIFDGEHDPFVLRAAELLFRPQRLTNKDGMVMLADEELVDGTDVKDPASPLVAIFGDAQARSLDVMTAENAEAYFGHSDAFHMAMDFRHGQPARDAFAKVIGRWVHHMHGLAVSVTPIKELQQADWHWYVGLDQDGTRIGNALWQGEEPPDSGRDRIVALFSLKFDDASDMLQRVAGQPVYLILGMTPNRMVRLKPQNLVTGLPVRENSA